MGWMLPSPAWKTFAMRRPNSSPSLRMMRRISGTRGHDAARDDSRYGGARVVDAIEDREQRSPILGKRHEAKRRLGDDAERTLRANHDAAEIVARRVVANAAELDDLAVGAHELDRQ